MEQRRIFVTRHSGAPDWAESHGLADAEFVAHLDPTTIKPGDVVLGTLPVHIAAEVLARGAVFYHVALDLKPEDRGKDLSKSEMEEAGARLEPYIVLHAPTPFSRHGWFRSAVNCVNIALTAARACWRARNRGIQNHDTS